MSNEVLQFKILTRHFFLRLFRNDLVDFEDQMKERVIGILAILAIFSGLLAYLFLGQYGYTPDRGQSWTEKTFFITFMMLVMGLAAVIEWDVMFPDRRDSANLGPLPLRTRTVFASKFASLLLFLGLFALSMNVLSSPFFILLLPQWRSSNPAFFVAHAIVHFLIMFSACFFAFFLYALLFGLFQALLGPRLFKKTSVFLRSLVLILQLFLVLTYLRVLVYGLNNLIPTGKLAEDLEKTGRFFDFFPPFWFVDLYETALGGPRLPFHGRYPYALVGLALMTVVFVLAMGLSYRRALLETAGKSAPPFWRARWSAERVFNGFFLRNSAQRAVFHFTRKTLKASTAHRMRLAMFLACGAALAPFLITMQAVRHGRLFGVNPTMLSIPLVLSFFLLLGLKAVMNVPVSLEASWVFQLTEWPNLRGYFNGVRKAVLILYLFPLFVMVFVVSAALWDFRTALYHSAYGLTVSFLVMEILFLRFLKIPFACSYLPGKEKIQQYWLLYLLGFMAYVRIAAEVEMQFLRHPSGLPYFLGTAILSVLGLRGYQVLFLYRRSRLQFEERPEPVMVDLDYVTPPHKTAPS